MTCAAGFFWDYLVNACVSTKPKTRPKPPTEAPLPVVVQLRYTTHTAPVNPGMVLSPALWIFVALATLGSILALALWVIIYRRRNNLSSTPENSEPQQEPLQKTEAPAIILSLPAERNNHTDTAEESAAGAPSPYSHLIQEAQTWQHAGAEGLSTVREHRIPLPATELGGTALVTTKTM